MIHDRLIENHPDIEGFQPGLALDWTLGADMKTYTFTLRQGVTFHNGDPFTAEDVIYTINRVRDVGIGSSAFDQWRAVSRATAPDPFTLVLELDDIDVDFLFGIARPRALFQSKSL
jgi:peptide/nickel transport system substrate-binding protein